MFNRGRAIFVWVLALLFAIPDAMAQQEQEATVEVTVNGEVHPEAKESQGSIPSMEDEQERPPENETPISPPVECNCDDAVQQAVSPLQAKLKTLQRQLKTTKDELQETLKVQEHLTGSIATLGKAKDAEVKSVRRSMASLQNELVQAKAELQQLSQTTFVKQFEKEATDLYQQILKLFR
mmetsp:Transcript_22913/g.63772  ORF Transcript_22913/g.63772 Transcript_22913/m.63772 type:complete len:180 (-) Transcript_22913:1429-1968(-)